MQEVLRPFSWFKPLTTYYIVKTEVVGRQQIIDGLTELSRRYPGRIRFVVTPLMQGRYQGILKSEEWVDLNERTD